MSEDPEATGASLTRSDNRLATHPTSRLSARIDLVDVAAEIARADESIATATNARLEVIAEQIRALQDKARAILDDARESVELHRARCNFVRRPGSTYHLYERTGGELYFSLLAPSDWSGTPPHPYRGSYRLEPDLRWTRVDSQTESPR